MNVNTNGAEIDEKGENRGESHCCADVILSYLAVIIVFTLWCLVRHGESVSFAVDTRFGY